ncbi:hypothetical protein DYB37_005754 [Aphanomyces astaci]|uniref:Uncharacterized protein n=1 Tax=Aphanomyces astaci TaxID=112090 RepID=A0A3R6XT99_APHAT|nr:hypothetical protein DYB35_008345 [Aphanomyces astaci]RHZ19744.1 hypothetical protein DYB37_005754 [Aphanomyces astaci]
MHKLPFTRSMENEASPPPVVHQPPPLSSPARRHTSPVKANSSKRFRLTKRASDYLVRAAAQPSAAPSSVIQAKLIRGDYHTDVERMVGCCAKAVVALEKNRLLASKSARRSEMRHADVTCSAWSPEDRHQALHQTFVAHLLDGIKLQLLHVRVRSKKPTVVFGNDTLTTLKWGATPARKPSATEFARGGTHTLHFMDVVSIAPWSNTLPPSFALKYKHLLSTKAGGEVQQESATSPPDAGGGGLHTVLIVYIHATKRAKEKQLLIQVQGMEEQTQLVDSFSKLVAIAKKKRGAFPLCGLGPLGVVVPEHVKCSPLTATTGDDGSNEHAIATGEGHSLERIDQDMGASDDVVATST